MNGSLAHELITQPWRMNAIFTAHRLRLFTRLAEQPKTVEELAAELDAVPRLLRVLLTACVGIGLVKLHNGRYANSEAAAFLVEGSPTYLGDIIHVLARETNHSVYLHQLITTGSSDANSEELAVEPPLFTRAMNNLGMLGDAAALAQTVDLTGQQQLVDVGGGSGLYSLTLCQRYPELHATVLDREPVLPTTEQYIAKAGLEQRVQTRVADIFTDPYGKEVDAILMSDVLYHRVELCLKMLKNAFTSLRPGGQVVIRGYLPDPEGTQNEFGALFALCQVVFEPDAEMTTPGVVDQWLNKSGFTQIRTMTLTERSTCLIARKPG